MKPTRLIHRLHLLVCAFAIASCVSTSTTFPDGRIVKETKPDAAAVSAFTNLAAAFAPKAVLVEDNSVKTTIHAAK